MEGAEGGAEAAAAVTLPGHTAATPAVPIQSTPHLETIMIEPTLNGRTPEKISKNKQTTNRLLKSQKEPNRPAYPWEGGREISNLLTANN